MTGPREQREAGSAATAHTEPEVIDDLDMTDDDAGDVGGGAESVSSLGGVRLNPQPLPPFHD
jgi:hypothetical protein